MTAQATPSSTACTRRRRPLIVVGAVVAGIAAGRASWPVLGLALAAVAVGAGSAFAGPAGAGAAAGAGLFIAVPGFTVTAWLRRS